MTAGIYDLMFSMAMMLVFFLPVFFKTSQNKNSIELES